MKQATDRLKINPPLGRMPVLQFIMPGELQVDHEYQRAIDGKSLSLIRRLAQHWNWDLCQPLVVARRQSGELFVIDGQHRLEAAKLRGDIAQLPCVVLEYRNTADEAASFVALNQVRKPLSALELFHAAIASGDSDSLAIIAAMERAGLALAPHYNHTTWKPGMVSNVGGLRAGWKRYGPAVSYAAMRALALAYPSEKLRFCGTIYPGLLAVCADEMAGGRDFVPANFELFVRMVGDTEQASWRAQVNRARAEDGNLNFANASAKVIGDAWAREMPRDPATGTPKPDSARGLKGPTPEGSSGAVAVAGSMTPANVGQARPSPGSIGRLDRFDARAKGGASWCGQCEQLRTAAQANACRSQWCKMRDVQAA